MKHLKYTETPITFLPYFSKRFGVNIYCKRDDLFSCSLGGSKARMLRYILADYEKYDVLLTAGGPFSNFNRACALTCASLGRQMHLVEYSENEEDFDISLNRYLCELAGVKFTRCEKTQVVETLAKIREKYTKEGIRFNNPYGGGRCIEGIYAYYEATKNLINQANNIDCIFVACGTGTTLTGILAGVEDFSPKTKVYGISVARNASVELPVIKENLGWLSKYTRKEYTLKNLNFVDRFLLGGYSKYNESEISIIREVASKEGIILDPTYTGKAFYGMTQIIQNDLTGNDEIKDIMFWHTGGQINLLSQKPSIV